MSPTERARQAERERELQEWLRRARQAERERELQEWLRRARQAERERELQEWLRRNQAVGHLATPVLLLRRIRLAPRPARGKIAS
jgi:hypothetical protein